MNFSLEEIDPTWRPFFALHIDSIDEILASLEDIEISPAREDIFRAFTFPLDSLQIRARIYFGSTFASCACLIASTVIEGSIEQLLVHTALLHTV